MVNVWPYTPEVHGSSLRINKFLGLLLGTGQARIETNIFIYF